MTVVFDVLAVVLSFAVCNVKCYFFSMASPLESFLSIHINMVNIIIDVQMCSIMHSVRN
jgi:hypothetical protein